MIKEKHGIQKINQNIKLYNVKNFKFKKKNSMKDIRAFLNQKKIDSKKSNYSVQIIKNVKKNGDKAVLNYEKKFSKIRKIIKYFFQKEINIIQKK